MLRRVFMSALLAAMVQFGSLSTAMSAQLVAADPSIEPVEVVAIQLKALQFNDNPTPDFGIAQTWNFAHPRNRLMTGPLPRFAAMIKAPAYANMIDHASHRISLADEQPGIQQFDVLLETKMGQLLYFQWTVEKVTTGEFKDCWMTVGVSMPKPMGQGS